MEDLLRQFNPWWEDDYTPPGFERSRYLDHLNDLERSKDVILLVGLRRAGKTTIMHQYVKRLIGEVDPRKVLYFSADNLAFEDHSLLDVERSFRSINSLNYDDHVHILIDEVHMKANFELQLKNLYDMGHSKVIASGSEGLDIILKSAHLTGRHRIVPVNPLTFEEYLEFKGHRIRMADAHLMPTLGSDYVTTGGMPEFVQTEDPNSLQSLTDTILYRDIGERHDIRNRRNLRNILLHIARSASTPISVRRISKTLDIPEAVVSLTIELLRESGLVHIVERQGKLPERIKSPKKYYLGDTGLFKIMADDINLGAKVENLVYLTLSRSSPEPVRYYRKDRTEVDFVQGKTAVESKYRSDITETDISRMKKLRGFRSRKIVSYDKEGDVDGVEIIPLWKFLQAHE